MGIRFDAGALYRKIVVIFFLCRVYIGKIRTADLRNNVAAGKRRFDETRIDSMVERARRKKLGG